MSQHLHLIAKLAVPAFIPKRSVHFVVLALGSAGSSAPSSMGCSCVWLGLLASCHWLLLDRGIQGVAQTCGTRLAALCDLGYRHIAQDCSMVQQYRQHAASGKQIVYCYKQCLLWCITILFHAVRMVLSEPHSVVLCNVPI